MLALRPARRRTVVVAVSLMVVAAVGPVQTAQSAPGSPASIAAAASAAAVPGVPAHVLLASTGTPASGHAPTSADQAAVTAAITAALGAKALGSDVAARVVDIGTGTPVFARRDTVAQKPASTLKLLTAMAALRALGDDARLTTRVVQGATPRDVVLVGAGDATLTRVRSTPATASDGQAAVPASLSDLVTRTVAALKKESRGSVTVHVDDSLFTGATTASGWPSSYVSSGVIAPVSALSVDQGARSAGDRSRSADPALAAGQAFAAALRKAGITVLGSVTRVTAPTSAAELASVSSPTIAELVERMLTESDDALAEALGHLAGGKLAGSASFEGGAQATLSVLQSLGVPTTGAVLNDASGLSLTDRLTTTTLVGALGAVVKDASAGGDNAGVLWPVSSGAPVAGLTGTLATRFDSAAAKPGRGVVRAKTGTLTGVDCLAGLVRDRHGRLIAFAYLADATPGPQASSRAALDRAAGALLAG